MSGGMVARIKRIRNLARFYYYQRIVGFAVPAEPHFDPASTPVFRSELERAKLYVEYGSGGSTMMAGRLGTPTVSIENDRFFARRVRAALPATARVRLIDIYLGWTVEWGNLVFDTPTEPRVARWSRYVMAPYGAPELASAFPDLMLVDGRFRRACGLEAARRAAEGGHRLTLIFDDYGDRPWYTSVEQYLGTPRMAGRAAIFEIGPDRPLAAPITPEIVAEAIRDSR